LAAIHFTVNDPVHGTRPGKANKDMALRGDTFVTAVQLVDGQEPNIWERHR
jgi:hypothetical protein